MKKKKLNNNTIGFRPEKTMRILGKLFQGDKVLDVGCSLGFMTNYFYEKGFDIKGIDIDESIIKEAKIIHPNINVEVGDFRELKEGEKYDTILFFGLLEYLEEHPLIILKQLEKHLTENGRIIISAGNIRSLRRRLRCLFNKNSVEPLYTRSYRFNKNLMSDLIEKSELKLIKITSTKICRVNKFAIPVSDNLSEDLIACVGK